MKDIVLSKHIRLKIECLALLFYTLQHGNGSIYLISLWDKYTHYFVDGDVVGLTISALLQIIAIVAWWYLCFRILTHYQFKDNDFEWISRTIMIAYVGIFFWLSGLIVWVIGAFFVAGFSLWSFFFSLVPIWNKSWAIISVLTIVNELPLETNIARGKRLSTFWITPIVVYITPYMVICIAVNLLFLTFSIWPGLIILLISAGMIGLYWALLPHSFCCCNRGKQCHDRISLYFLGYTSVIFLLLTQLLFNVNSCRGTDMLFEFAFGFRGAAFLMLLYCLYILLELHYNGRIPYANQKKEQQWIDYTLSNSKLQQELTTMNSLASINSNGYDRMSSGDEPIHSDDENQLNNTDLVNKGDNSNNVQYNLSDV